MPSSLPVIPTEITVHLAPPDTDAENITVPFSEYIKNVTSSEIYPTWPENAIRANIYAIVSFALNRIYTEWYPSRGYNFDITNSTAYDQAFFKNREIYENIGQIVDEIFNDYVVRQGNVEPLFTQFCNGTTSTCDGLSQWGSVTLAEQGLSPYEILQNFYGENINIIENAPVQNIPNSYPETPLILGSAGNDVMIIQNQLNRISENYPAIPKISVTVGIFDNETQAAVREFQKIFDLEQTATVNKATWYKIKRIYNGVKRLSELDSEGLKYEETITRFPDILQFGDSGYTVSSAQYYLNVLGYFNPNLNIFPINGNFDIQTQNAVENFQREYGLAVTGTIGRNDWRKITNVYDNVLNTLSDGYEGVKAKLYPGYFLTEGMTGSDVRDLQSYLALIGRTIPEIPEVAVDGIYGQNTKNAVAAFQKFYGIPETGYVGPLTWHEIGKEYNTIILRDS